MSLLRTLISALVAVAIIFAPAAVAWMSLVEVAGDTAIHSHAVGIDHGNAASEAATEHCASKSKAASDGDDCPYCAGAGACPTGFCLAKCLQFVGLDQHITTSDRLITAQVWPDTPTRSIGWSDRPQPPPPRT